MVEAHGIAPAPVTPQMFGNAGREHMAKYGKYTQIEKSGTDQSGTACTLVHIYVQ